MLDFIRANRSDRMLIVSTDPVVPWELQHGAGDSAMCASFFLQTRHCLATGQSYDTVVLIHGHSDRSGRAAFMRDFADTVSKQIAGRRKIVTLHAGYDADAALKTRLTGVPLSVHVLTTELYR